MELQPVADRVGGLDLVVVGPNDPEAMVRHTEECRFRGYPVRRRPVAAAGPDGRRRDPHAGRRRGVPVHQRVRGRAHRAEDRLDAARRSSSGSACASPPSAPRARWSSGAASRPSYVHCPQEERRADPTGVGDAFRAGFLAGVAWGLSPERCCQIGSMLATYVIETVGTQEYELGQARLLERLAGAYGDEAAEEIGARRERARGPDRQRRAGRPRRRRARPGAGDAGRRLRGRAVPDAAHGPARPRWAGGRPTRAACCRWTACG